MKRLLVVAMIGMFLTGCGTLARDSEFWKHDTMYKNGSHLKYSWSGYKECNVDTGKKSKEQIWWGIQQDCK